MSKSANALLLIISLAIAAPFAKKLDTLTIEGLRSQQPNVIDAATGLQRGKEFTSLDIQEAVRSLYRLGSFRKIDFYSTDETDSTASLLLKVEEYPVCEALEYNGFKKIKPKDKEVADKLSLSKGQAVTDAVLHENITVLKNAYEKKGFLLADVSTELVETKIPGNVIVKFNAKEGTKVRIKQIVFEGNSAFDAKKLKRKFKTKENKWFNNGEFKREEYTKDLDTLVQFYQEKGYLDAAVVGDSVWYGPDKKDIFIKVKLEEGRKYYVGDFYFTGNKILTKEDLASRVALRRGKPFEKNKYEMAKAMIANAYREEGYLWVQLRDQFQYRNDTIDVVFDVAEGRPAIVRKVDVEGNNKTFEKVIRRELRMYPGQKYRQSRMERSIRDVMALNYFDNVTPDLRPNEDGTIDLVVKVKEKENIGQFSAGVVYSQLEGFGGNFSIAIPNFRGRGQELSAKTNILRYRQDLSLDFTEPWFMDNPTSLSGSLFFQRYIYSYGAHDTTLSGGFRVGAGRRLKWPDDYFTAQIGYQFSREEELGSSIRPTHFGIVDKGMLSKLSFTLRRNDTDVPNFPTRGSIFSLQGDIAGLGGLSLGDTLRLGGRNISAFHNYLKTDLKYDFYFPLLWKFVLGFKSEFGWMGGLGPQPKISRWDLFSAGGVSYGGQLRGYQEETFGGRSHPDQGTTMLVTSTELRFPILEQQLYFGLFYDMGNTWGSLGDIDLTRMKKGVGCGVRLLFPMIGLLGFDLGWKLDDPNASHFGGGKIGGQPEVHFLIGRGF
jgi:outer membrane protein insertion porin family